MRADSLRPPTRAARPWWLLDVGSSRLHFTLALLVAGLLLSCGKAPQMRGKLAGLQQIAQQAERNGAVRCAPRELALAQSHLTFAETELQQGFMSKAEYHLGVAEPNANAALALSPPEHCTSRDFVEQPGDRDADGYLDPEDGCPDEPENFNDFEDEDGCPDSADTDGDGILDDADSCVVDAEDGDGYLDADGCPEVDNDLDRIVDADDACPNDPEDPDGYEDDDGCPDADNDQDGVPDVQDECPNEVGSKDKKPLGCPIDTLAIVTNCEVKILQQIHFEFNKDTIRPVSFPVLDAVVDILARNPSIKLEVQGHTDDKGTAEYNYGLSNRRSTSVKQYLVSHGIAPDRLTSRGYGFDRPIVPNDTAENRALNRRVQFIRTEGAREGCEGNSP